jgi:hypothetical protein
MAGPEPKGKDLKEVDSYQRYYRDGLTTRVLYRRKAEIDPAGMPL